MKIIEIVQQAKADAPEQLSKMPDTRAVKLLSLAFAQIRGQLAALDEGELKVTGLGVFRVRQVQVEKDGVKKAAKRILFSAVKPKPKPKVQ